MRLSNTALHCLSLLYEDSLSTFDGKLLCFHLLLGARRGLETARYVVFMQVDRFRGMKEFPKVASQVMAGSKPCFAFAGDEFETKPEYMQLKVRRREVENPFDTSPANVEMSIGVIVLRWL
jgi:hypothetical protein